MGLFEWLFGKKKQQRQFSKERKPMPDKCEYEKCNRNLSVIKGFYCSYCKKYHCEKHRVPETHSCKGNLSNPYV